tara:strand:- start:2676 stop:3680 length:1005 start_codon:yes stop_codon:yes gene_type:complete
MKIKFLLLIFMVCFLIPINITAQITPEIRQEKEEQSLDDRQKQKSTEGYKMSQKVAIYYGYDSNANLATERKGDSFEEVVYSIDFAKLLNKTLRITFDYDIDFSNYHETTDLTNFLNHFRLGVQKQLPFCLVGFGYDAGFVNYTRGDSDFILHKGFVYFGKKTSNRIYQKIQFEYGAKDYLDISALGDSLGSFQEKERLDRRIAAEYSLSALLTPKTMMRLRTKFSRNDSNARFVDFYDYTAYSPTLVLSHKFLKDVIISTNLSYRRKEYDSRTISGGSEEQSDNLYVASLGVQKMLDKKTSVSLQYTYRENSSNESLEEYSESVITCGWHYNF